MAPDQSWGNAGGGDFFRILGIIYLIKLIRNRRKERRERADQDGAGDSPVSGDGRAPRA